MLKIRLKKVGRKGQASFRIVVTESTTPRGGRSLEEIGFYNPRGDVLRVDSAKAQSWIAKGAQATGTVGKLLARAAAAPAVPAAPAA